MPVRRAYSKLSPYLEASKKLFMVEQCLIRVLVVVSGRRAAVLIVPNRKHNSEQLQAFFCFFWVAQLPRVIG